MLNYLENKLKNLENHLDNLSPYDVTTIKAEQFRGSLFMMKESDILSNPILYVEQIDNELLRFGCKLEFSSFNIKEQTLYFYFGSNDGEHWNQGSISREKAEDLLKEIISTICNHYRLYVKD